MQKLFIFTLLMSLIACNKESDFGAKIEPIDPPYINPVLPPDGDLPGPELMTETFVQKSAQEKQVDFLWVIDDSGSMQQEQENLANNFSTFIQSFLDKNVYFRMRITTTDVSTDTKCGRIIPGSDLKLNSEQAQANEAQFITDFETLIQVGINGSGTEAGLRASECFIDKHAPMHLRPEAYLAVIYVTDEQDQSIAAPEHYLQKLRSIKSKPELVKAYSIVNVQGLTYGQNLTLGYDRYDYVSVNSGGSTHDIFSNFANTLVSIGDQLIDLLESFNLKYAPLAGTLVVKVEGVVQVLNTDYTLVGKSIKFKEGSVPDAGSRISVSYKY